MSKTFEDFELEKIKQIKDREKSVLGPLLHRPSLLESSDIRITDFFTPEAQKTFSGLTSMWEDLKPEEIDIRLLFQRISSGNSNDGIATFIASCEDGSIKVEAENFRERLRLLRRATLELEMLRAAKENDHPKLASLAEEYKKLSENKDKEIPLVSWSQLRATEVHVSWLVDRLIPEGAISVIYAPGGTGKSTLALQISSAVAEGRDLFGLRTAKKAVVYLDYENPIAVLVDRVGQLPEGNVLFWPLHIEPHPPLLDSENFSLLFNLPEESVLIFDSLRSAFSGDENSSQDVSIVFSRLKQLREAGYSIILLHHTPKANDKTYKGSTAISDLADHTLCLSRVNEEGKEIETSELLPDTRYFFGTGQKSRYERYGVFLFFDGKQFTLAPDPNEEALREIHAYLLSEGPKSQAELRKWMSDNLGIKNLQKRLSLLRKGENRFWTSIQENRKKPKLYTAIDFGNTLEIQEKIQ